MFFIPCIALIRPTLTAFVRSGPPDFGGGRSHSKQLDYVVFCDKPLLKFDRLPGTHLAYAPAGLRSFMMAMPLWPQTKLHLPCEIRTGLDNSYCKRVASTGHPESRAASRFLSTCFEEAAILALDGVGDSQLLFVVPPPCSPEWDTRTVARPHAMVVRFCLNRIIRQAPAKAILAYSRVQTYMRYSVLPRFFLIAILILVLLLFCGTQVDFVYANF